MTVEAPPTTLDAAALVRRLRATFATGRTKSFEWRDGQLDALAAMLSDGEKDIVDALSQDLGRPPFESWAADVQINVREFKDIKKHYRKWAGEQKMRTPAFFKPAKSSVRFDPLGTVLIISPWNYPVQLLVSPLAAAIAAGNTAVCKPSELAPATSEVLVRLADQYLDREAIVFVEGGIPESTALLEQRWDHILYTGNGAVGRVVATAAAKHLTPVTLELGGKSPAIVAADANVKLAASRIAGAKFANAGQTCVGVDHVYVHRDAADALLNELEDQIALRYGADPRRSSDFGRIVNQAHTERIKGLLDAGGFEVLCGGEVSVEDRYVAPTILRGVATDAAVMGEEIFGPVLPVLTFDDLAEPLRAITSGPKPLALYLFTSDDDTADRVLAESSSGGVCINDTLTHVGVPDLPFGGVGASGYGAYHGRAGFEAFSHRKSVLRRPPRYPDPPLLRPPYARWKTAVTRRVL